MATETTACPSDCDHFDKWVGRIRQAHQADCPACGNFHITGLYPQTQHRLDDNTVLVTCGECGHRWTYHDSDL